MLVLVDLYNRFRLHYLPAGPTESRRHALYPALTRCRRAVESHWERRPSGHQNELPGRGDAEQRVEQITQGGESFCSTGSAGMDQRRHGM